MELKARDILGEGIDKILKYDEIGVENGGGFDMSGYGNASFHNMGILSKFKDYMVPKKIEDRVSGVEHRETNFIFPGFWKGCCSLTNLNAVHERSKKLEGYDFYSGGLSTSQIIFDIITNQNETILNDIQEELDEKNKFILTLSEEDTKIFNDVSVRVPMNKVIKLFKRNQKLVKVLKQLYNNKCQICGFTFKKDDGKNYSETHHIIELGESGSDDIKNMIVVCPNCHKKLHYAKKEKYDIKYKKEHYDLLKKKNGIKR